jgi:hypothetical protein
MVLSRNTSPDTRMLHPDVAGQQDYPPPWHCGEGICCAMTTLCFVRSVRPYTLTYAFEGSLLDALTNGRLIAVEEQAVAVFRLVASLAAEICYPHHFVLQQENIPDRLLAWRRDVGVGCYAAIPSGGATSGISYPGCRVDATP